jgi:glycosyltransferase involved in cell wall biosynthesis
MDGRETVGFFVAAPGGVGGGGAERVVISLANGFARMGVRTDLVMKHVNGPYLSLVSDQVNVVDLGAHIGAASSNPLAKARRFLSALSRLRSYILERRPRAIISAVTLENLVAVMARKLAGSDCRLLIGQRDTMSRMSRWYSRALARWLYPHSDGVVAVSRGVADDLVKVVPGIRDKVFVVYNPVDLDGIRRLSQDEPDHPWFRSRGHQVVLAVGGLKPVKDFASLIRAFEQARKTRPLKLVILGDGPERGRLEALVSELGLSEDVSLPGFTANPYACMSRSAVFVLSSRTEGFPNVLLEALACGCPVVSTDCQSGPGEILEDGKWGELVQVGDAEALAAAVVRTLENPLPVEQLRSRAAFYSVDRAVGQYYRALHDGVRK